MTRKAVADPHGRKQHLIRALYLRRRRLRRYLHRARELVEAQAFHGRTICAVELLDLDDGCTAFGRCRADSLDRAGDYRIRLVDGVGAQVVEVRREVDARASVPEPRVLA